MRSATISWMYAGCEPDESLDLWPHSRIWDELSVRLATDGVTIPPGPIMQKGVTPVRSYVVIPMQDRKSVV